MKNGLHISFGDRECRHISDAEFFLAAKFSHQNIEFSEHLNAVIGGRGTGKSTLIESLRYVLEKRPSGKNAEKQHDEIIKENHGKEKGRVEVTIRSSTMNGKRFVVSRRYGESTIVKDESGNISTFTSNELLPLLEIYGQNEIYEIAQDQQGQLKLFKRFLDVDSTELDKRLLEISIKMNKSRSDLLEAQQHLADIEDEVARLPKLLEQVAQFKELGLEERLKIVPKLEQEKRLSKRVGSELEELEDAIAAFKEHTPDTVYLSEAALEELPHADQLRQIKTVLDGLKNDFQPLVSKIDGLISEAIGKISDFQKKLQTNKECQTFY